MRKHMIILATVLLLTTVGSVAVICKLRNLEKNVVLTVTTYDGNSSESEWLPRSSTLENFDASKAEGLVISFMERVDEKGESVLPALSNRQWAHTIRFDGSGSKTESVMLRDSDESIAGIKKREENEDFLAKSSQGIWVYNTYEIQSYNLYSIYELMKFLPEELMDDIRKSGEKKEVRLSEYLEYYPMISSLSLPNNQESQVVFVKNAEYPYIDSGKIIYSPSFYENMDPWDVERLFEGRTDVDHRETEKAARKLQEFFRIPVLKDDVREIAYELKGEEYEYYDETMEVIGDDSYSPEFAFVVTDNALCFTFQTHTAKGNTVDTSLIPGGYGIYILPYTIDTETGITTAHADELRLFSPLDPEAEIKVIYSDKSQKTLMVVYCLGEKYYVRLIDLTSGETLCDDAIVTEWPEGTDRWSIFADYGDDMFLVNAVPFPVRGESDDTVSYVEDSESFYEKNAILAVYGKNADGTYGRLLTTNADVEYSGGGYMAFDNGRFVQVVNLYSLCLRVYVYTDEGLVYKADISSSLRDSLRQVEEYENADVLWGVECRWE